MSAAGHAISDQSVYRLDLPLTVVFLGARFIRSDGLVSGLQSLDFGIYFKAHSSVLDWLAVKSKHPTSLIVIDKECFSAEKSRLGSELSVLTRHSLRFAVFSEFEDPCSVMEALRLGARGFIPANLPLPILLQTLKFIVVGGIFIPLASLVLLLSQRHRPIIQMTLGYGDSSAIDLSDASAWTKTISDEHKTGSIADDSAVREHLTRIFKGFADKQRRW